MNHTTIHHTLSAWGRRARETPPHNEKLKSEIIARLVIPSSPSIHQQAPHSFPWASFALAGFALLTLLIMPTRIDQHVFSPEPVINKEPVPNILNTEELRAQTQKNESAQYKTMAPAPSFHTNDKGFNAEQEIPIMDPREYLKTDYHAAIYTRGVQELAQRIQTTVRGFGGRVDAMKNSPTYGFMSFVIPASQLSVFQDEIRNIAGKRFIIEDVYTQNMLPQKQSIEQGQESAKKTIVQLNADRAELTTAHGRVLTAIQSQLAAYVYELDQLRREVTTDGVRQAQITLRIQELLKEEKIVNARLQNENADYGRNFQSVNAKIIYAKNNLENLNTQDGELLDTVATVRGTISLEWISWWQVVNLSIPFPWLPILLMGAAITTYVIGRRRNRLLIS